MTGSMDFVEWINYITMCVHFLMLGQVVNTVLVLYAIRCINRG